MLAYFLFTILGLGVGLTGVLFVLYPFITIGDALLDISDIRENATSTIATIIHRTTVYSYIFRPTDIIEFDGYEINKNLPKAYSNEDQITIVYNNFHPENFYIGKIDDSIISVLSKYVDNFVIIIGYSIFSTIVIIFGLFLIITNKKSIRLSIKRMKKKMNTNLIGFNQKHNFLSTTNKDESLISLIAIRIVKLILIVLLLIALAGHSRSFVNTLRWILFFSFPYLLYRYLKIKDYNWFSTFLIIWIVYNPLIRFVFERNVWVLIDLATIVALIISFFFENSRVKHVINS